MEETKQKDVIFVTSKYKGLELVHTPMGLKDKQGNKVPSIRCHFVPTAYGYAYHTHKPELIKWLDEHDHMAKGIIQRFDPKDVQKVESIKVSKGVTSVPTIPEEPIAPVEVKKGAHVVKIKK